MITLIKETLVYASQWNTPKIKLNIFFAIKASSEEYKMEKTYKSYLCVILMTPLFREI
jgi:hypothetical protein